MPTSKKTKMLKTKDRSNGQNEKSETKQREESKQYIHLENK